MFDRIIFNRDDINDAINRVQEDIAKNMDMELNAMRTVELESEYNRIARKFEIKNVIFNDPATIVFWKDGSKTVVKASGEKFDKEKGLAMAVTKKILGLNRGNFNNIFKKWCKEENND